MSRNHGGEGAAQKSPWPDAADACSAGARPKVYACWSCLRNRASAAGCGEHSVDPPVPLRACSETWKEPLVGRSRPDPGLCCARGFEWHALHRDAGGLSPFPTDGCQSGQEGGLCMVV